MTLVLAVGALLGPGAGVARAVDPPLLPGTAWPEAPPLYASPAPDDRQEQEQGQEHKLRAQDRLIRQQSQRLAEQEQQLREQERRLHRLLASNAGLDRAPGAVGGGDGPVDAVAGPAPRPGEGSWDDAGLQREGRRLNGHSFLPSDEVFDPFVVTRFGSKTGFGSQWGSVVTPDARRADISAFTLSQGFTLSLALTDFLGLEVDGGGSFFTGNDFSAIFDSGVEGGYQVGGRTKVVLGGNRWFQVALDAEAGLSKDYIVNLGPTFDSIAAQTEAKVARTLDDISAGRVDVTDPRVQEQLAQQLLEPVSDQAVQQDLLSLRRQSRFGGGLQVATGLHRSIGLVGNAKLRYVKQSLESPVETVEVAGGDLIFGGLLSFDLRPVSPVPVGLTMLYQAHSFLGSSSDELAERSADAYGGGLFYTGRENLGLGLETIVLRHTGFREIQGSLRLWYYW